MAKIYHFSAVTAEFIGEEEAVLDPIDKLPLVPANATKIAPLAPREGYARRFAGEAWELVEDHRGTKIWGADGAAQIVDELGALPEGVLLLPPELPTYPNLDSARRAVAACVDGFLAEVTGAVPEYERASWPSKADAARAFLSDAGAPEQVALLQGEAEIVGEAVAETAAKIAANADQYEAIISRATGVRRVIDAELVAVAQAVDYEAIVLSTKNRVQDGISDLIAP